MSNFKKESLEALGQAISLLPLVTNKAGVVIEKTASAVSTLMHVADEAVRYLAVELDMVRLRQDAENAPVIAALKVIGIISTSMSDVDLTALSYDEKVLHLEKCFELIGKINKLLADMDTATGN